MQLPPLGPPVSTFGQGGPPSGDADAQALWDSLAGRPIKPIPIPATAADLKVLGVPCILDGWILRETTGLAPAVVEFFDGQSSGGQIVGELTIPAPSQGQNGINDVEVDASSSTPASANNVTLAGAAGATTFITGFEITGGGATAGSFVIVTVTGILGGTKVYLISVPAGANLEIVRLLVEFSRPIPASGLNTAIVVNVPTFGAGNLAAAVTAHGFQRTLGASGANAGQAAGGPAGVDQVLCRNGLFMRVISGSVTGSIWVRV